MSLQKDYPELEGVVVKTDFDEECVVVGCNYDVGITILDKKDSTVKVYCLNGPNSPHWEYFCDHYPLHKKNYSALFYSSVRHIKKGKVLPGNMIYSIVDAQRGGGGAVCAFEG